MPRKRFQTEKIIQKLREVEVLFSQGRNVSKACRQIGVTDNTYYCWRKEYRGIRSVAGWIVRSLSPSVVSEPCVELRVRAQPDS